MGRAAFFLGVLFVASLALCCCSPVAPEVQQILGAEPYASKEGLLGLRKRCPLCDASVYPYCSEKLLHDACCCLDPIDTPLPYQCSYADCSFLHANSCQEHKLITACCCNRGYYFFGRNWNDSL